MLGFEFSTDSSTLNASLKKINVCFLHAPLFHPTLKKVAPVRKQLGVRTLFNSLGPLVNPVQPDYQLTGTYALDLAKMYQHVLRPHRKGYSVLYGMDGYDEITLTDSTRMFSKTSETHLTAELIGRESVEPQNLRSGGSVESSAQILCNVLQGKGSNAQTDVVAANVSVAIQTIEGQSNAFDSYNEVQQFIRSGQAAKHFRL
jgi:anthranilate phosphoribosyltransferase